MPLPEPSPAGLIEWRPLGRSGLTVTRLGLGCVTFGREIGESRSFEVLDYAFDNGIRVFDTAEGYGGGQARAYRREAFGVDDEREVSGEQHSSEKILGRWLESRGVRSQVVLVTKIAAGFTRDHVREALGASLDRLRTGYVDAYLLHQFDPSIPPEEAVVALDAVVREGLARATGFSNHTADQARTLMESAQRMNLAPPLVAQLHYNLVARECEADLLPLSARQAVGVLTYSPLAAGFLTGKYAGGIPARSRFDVIPGHTDVYFNERNFKTVERLHEFSRSVGTPPERLAVGWVLRRPGVDSVLIGARNVGQVRNALDAVGMEFPDQWLRALDALSA